MPYAVPCCNFAETFGSRSRQQGAATTARLAAVENGLAAAGKLGPVARLLPIATFHPGGNPA
jgi:hypothetical protein